MYIAARHNSAALQSQLLQVFFLVSLSGQIPVPGAGHLLLLMYCSLAEYFSYSVSVDLSGLCCLSFNFVLTSRDSTVGSVSDDLSNVDSLAVTEQ